MPSTHVIDAPPPAPGHALRISVEGRTIAVFNLGTGIVAIDAECPHVRGPLEKGRIEGNIVTCPWHGSQFDLTNGAVRRGPATRPVTPYPVRIVDQKLVVDLP